MKRVRISSPMHGAQSRGSGFTDTYTINNCFVIGYSTVFLSEEKREFRAVVSLTDSVTVGNSFLSRKMIPLSQR